MGKRKRKVKQNDGSVVQEPADPSTDRVRAELETFICNKDRTLIKAKTITTSYDRVAVQANHRKQLQDAIKTCSNAMGILSHLVTVYLNVKAQQDPSFEHLTTNTYINQLFDRFACMSLEAKKDIIEDPYIEDYLMAHPVSSETLEVVQTGFNRRVRDGIVKVIVKDSKKHIVSNFAKRVKEHIVCDLERRVWSHRRDKYFNSMLVVCSHAVFQSAIIDDDTQATSKIKTCLMKERGGHVLHSDWKQALEAASVKFRSDFQHFRIMPPDLTALSDESDRIAYNNHINNFPESCIYLLQYYREEDVQYRIQRRNLAVALNDHQPRLKSTTTVDGVYKQLNVLKQVQVPTWAVAGNKQVMDATQQDEFKSLLKQTQTLRSAFWEDHVQPGGINTPAAFTLLPVTKLKPAFIPIDPEVLSTMSTSIKDKMSDGKRPFKSGRSTRLWWTPAFNFHEKKEIKRQSAAAPSTKRRRAVLKTKRNHMQSGVRLLWQEAWVLKDADYDSCKQKADLSSPHLVNSLLTDGEQVKCTVCYMVDGNGEGEDASAIGTSNIKEKGFGMITQTFELGKHSRGIFKKAAPLSNEILQILDEEDLACFIEAIGVDPGQLDLVSFAKAKLTSGTTVNDFKASTNVKAQQPVHNKFSCSDYKYESLGKAASKFEATRKAVNINYKIALQQFSVQNASLSSSATTQIYVSVMYNNLDTMWKEQMSQQRREFRFARFRARQRTIDHMMRKIIGGDADSAALRHMKKHKKSLQTAIEENNVELINKLERHGELMKKMQETIASGKLATEQASKTWTRIVFFGNAQFSNGSRGPLPRKAVIIALSARCVVILTDEFR
eukprot:5265-Heterococcus_DN1.PRE.2